MGAVGGTLAILIGTGLLLGILYMVGHFLRGIAGLGLHGITGLGEQEKQLLARHCSYYAGLAPRAQRRFRQRVKGLLFEKEWIGRGISVTLEMRVRIAASIAQVTFGFDDLLLLHFRNVVVYPDAYRNPRTGRMHIGEVAPGAGLLIFSWKHFTEGFADPADARNLAIHEVAHALWFENSIPNAEDDFLDHRALHRWNRLAQEEMARINAGKSRLFRDYAGTNSAEFFAVAVEYFFEQPVEYRDSMPELYGTMCVLLRQDPTRRDH